MGHLYMKIQLMLEFLKAPFFVINLSYYTSMAFLMMLSLPFISMLMILLSTLSEIRHVICVKNLEVASELEPDLQDTVD